MLRINTKHISTDDRVLSGKPCIRNNRFSLAQLLTEIVDDKTSLEKICKNYNLSLKQVEEAIHDLAWCLDEAQFDDDGNRIKIREK